MAGGGRQYSGVVQGRALAMVLLIETGTIDRGADISELSQYPGEREFLWVPCSFLEPHGAPTVELVEAAGGGAGGVVTVVRVRVSANLKALTVEELRTQKRDMHLTAFRYLLDETRRELDRIASEEGDLPTRVALDWSRVVSLNEFLEIGGREEDLPPGLSDGTTITFTAEGLLARLAGAVEAVAARHAAVPPGRYADGEAYRALVAEMLDTAAAAACALRWYLEDPGMQVNGIMRFALPEMRRRYLGFLERTLPGEGAAGEAAAAGRLCRAMGAMGAAADEADAEGLAPLLRAAADGAGARVLRCLVAARADVNGRDVRGGRTALYMAAGAGHADAVEALARLGGDVDAAERTMGQTPAWIAAQEGHVAVIEALGRLGADVNRPRSNGCAPLKIAVQQGRTAAADSLRRLGAA